MRKIEDRNESKSVKIEVVLLVVIIHMNINTYK